MDFFNVSKNVGNNVHFIKSDSKNCVYNIDLSGLKSDTEIFRSIQSLDSNLGTYFSIANLDFATKATLGEIANKKPLYCGLVSNSSNHLAGTTSTLKDLEEFGIYAIKRLSSNNITIDLKNLSEKAFMSVIRLSPNSCIVTDAGLSSIYGPNVLREYQEKILVDTNSLICLSITKNKASLFEIADSIFYFRRKFGVKNLCIGSHDLTDRKMKKQMDLLEMYLISYGFGRAEVRDIFFNNAYLFAMNNTMRLAQ